MEPLRKLVDAIRDEVSCCCSWTRYEAVNKLLDEMETEMKLSVELDTEEWVPEAMKSSMDTVLQMLHYYREAFNRHDVENKDYLQRQITESVEDYNALVHVHNYYSPVSEHLPKLED